MTGHHERHFDKKELKKPDLLTEELKKGFQWSTSHTKLIGVLTVLFIVGGLLYSFVQYRTSEKEAKASNSFALVEKDYQKKKEAFEKYVASTAQKNTKAKDGKDKPQEPQGEKATGELDKDYGVILQGFQKVIDEHQGTKAAIMAVLSMNEIYLQYQKADLALQTTQKVKTGNDSLSSLLLSQKGTIQANMNDCKSAVETWGQLLNNKSAQFFHSDVLLKQALCYETLNDKKKAEEALNKVIAESKDGSLAKSAEKYLRIMKTDLPSTVK